MSTVSGIGSLRLSQLLSPEVNGEWVVLSKTEQGETLFKPINDMADVTYIATAVSTRHLNGDILVIGTLSRGNGWEQYDVHITNGGKEKKVFQFNPYTIAASQ